MALGDTIKLEKVTLLIATEVYTTGPAAKGATGLDNIMQTLNAHLDADCKILDSTVEEYRLFPHYLLVAAAANEEPKE